MRSDEGLSEHRLHPASLFFSIGGAARSLLLPGLFLLFAAHGSSYQYWVMLAFVPAVVAALVKYWSYRYRFAEGELVIHEGVVTRNERHVPYAHIQNIDLVQNVLHRLIGVAEVRVETAGGEKPEAIMRVLSLAAVERMRTLVFAERAAGESAAGASLTEPPPPWHVMSWRDLLLLGVLSNKGMVVVAAVLGLVWQFDPWERLAPWLTREQLASLEVFFRPGGATAALLLGAGAVLVLLILMRLLSIAWAFFRFYGFRLSGRGDDLRAEHGLLTRRSKTIPRHRIQVLSTQEGPLHRWCGRTSVYVQTAGSAADDEEGQRGRLWLAPLIRAEAVGELLRHALPELSLAEVPWQPIASRAWIRLFRQRLIVLLPAFAVAAWGIQAWNVHAFGVRIWAPVAAIGFVALGLVDSRLQARHAGFAVVSGAVLSRSGWWVRRRSVVRFSKIQSVEHEESPFDRRNRMASITVDTAGASAFGSGIDIRLLDAPIATALLGRLSAEAGRTRFRW